MCFIFSLVTYPDDGVICSMLSLILKAAKVTVQQESKAPQKEFLQHVCGQ